MLLAKAHVCANRISCMHYSANVYCDAICKSVFLESNRGFGLHKLIEMTFTTRLSFIL